MRYSAEEAGRTILSKTDVCDSYDPDHLGYEGDLDAGAISESFDCHSDIPEANKISDPTPSRVSGVGFGSGRGRRGGWGRRVGLISWRV